MYRRAHALSRLVPYLPAELQQQVVAEAFALVRRITDEGRRVEALSRLALYQMKRTQDRSALDSFLAVASISYGYKRSPALRELVLLWQAFGYGGLHLETWPRLLRLLAARPRSDLLSDLTLLLPLIQHLGSDEVIGELLRAIQDVSKWWP